MKNLEIKFKLGNDYEMPLLSQYFVQTLNQIDTYIKSNMTGTRLKIRKEDNNCYAINYLRDNVEQEKISNYLFYQIDDYDMFMKVFGAGFEIETIVEKTRELYKWKNARIHFDNVKNLGKFVEIEVVISNDVEEAESYGVMNDIIIMFNLDKQEKISLGYKELIEQSKCFIQSTQEQNKTKNLEYYANTNKVYWYINEDITQIGVKKNDIVPCIFVEVIDNKYYILQLDLSIQFDEYKYTGWRKLIGQEYGIRTDILLIKDMNLYNLQGKQINFNDLFCSSKYIDKSFLAKFI